MEMKSWLAKNGIEMYSMHNEGKSVAAEESSRTLKNKMYKYMTSISKNMYIDKLGNVIKYRNTYKTIKSKPVDVKPSIYIDFDKRNNEEDPKFKVGDNIRISKLQKKIRKSLELKKQ